jgi:hypothetical protein
MDPIARNRGLASSGTDIASGNRSACLIRDARNIFVPRSVVIERFTGQVIDEQMEVVNE